MATVTRRLGRGQIDDFWLYDAECVRVGVLLFGERVCADCGRGLPACSDYFTATQTNAGGLKPACKRCTAARYREANKQRRQRRRDEALAERLMRELCVRTARMCGAVRT